MLYATRQDQMTGFATNRQNPLLPKRLDAIALWLIAALHLAVAVSFLIILFSLSQAHAAEPESCGGTNLLTEMQQSDPERYAAVVSEGDKVPNGKGLFWKIEKPGLPTSYLLGTMHVTDPRVLKMPAGAATAQASANTIIIESDEILDDQKAMAALLMKPDLMMFTDGTSITDLISPEDKLRLETGLKERGITLAVVAKMKPWMISSFVSLPPCEFTRKAAGASFLDKKIALDAIAAGKTVAGLETLSEQLVAMSELPVKFHLQALIETLQLGPKMSDIMETMTELYLSGDIGMTMPMLKAVSPPETPDESGYASFEQRIILDRNTVMATRSAPYFEKGGIFMAVGALHLPGDAGVIALLRKQGYTVTAAN